jgi:Haem-binding domain
MNKRRIGLGVVAVFGLMQLVILKHDNPPVTGQVQAPPDVMTVLKRSCFDCHSNETVWPWYGRLAPVSFLLQRDVVEGRKHMNFSTWSSLPPEKKKKKQHGVGKQVGEGEMPPWFYLPMHSAARLSDADKKVLDDWSKGPVSD